MTPAGAVTVLHVFTGGTTDGAEPYGLMEDPTSPGRFYGVTRQGGPADAGSLLKLDAGGVTIQFFFDGTNADSPIGTLVQGSDGKLYGGAAHGLSIGGTQDRGVLY